MVSAYTWAAVVAMHGGNTWRGGEGEDMVTVTESLISTDPVCYCLYATVQCLVPGVWWEVGTDTNAEIGRPETNIHGVSRRLRKPKITKIHTRF